MKEVTIFYNSPQQHLTQAVTGFLLLKEQGKISLTIEYGKFKKHCDYLKVLVDGKLCIYDMADSSIIKKELYNECDYYFKRMCLKTDLETYPKLFPYGFNYSCFTKGTGFLKMNLKIYPIKKMTELLRITPFMGKFIGMTDTIEDNYYKNYECNPAEKKPFIVFSARLWNPEKSNMEDLKEERIVINEERIDMITKLKANFGKNYIGGIYKNEFSAKRAAADVLISKEHYKKSVFIRTIKKSSIGIATPGLENSVGYKLAEYLASSMAILTHPHIKDFAFPGDFSENKNYFCYQSANECVAIIKNLLSNDAVLKKMIANNNSYYGNYLSPDKLIENTLAKVA